MPDYTSNLKFSNPLPGECQWDNDWHRNQFLKDIICGVLLSTNRVIEGGLATATAALNVLIPEGTGTVEGVGISWEAQTVTVTQADPGEEYLSTYIYFDSAGTLFAEITPPILPFLPIAMIDVDEIDIVRVVDIRPLSVVVDPDAAVSKIITGTNITDVFLGSTSDDSDGGAWLNQTQLTSWYNEELNTATRGATRNFPKEYLIIAEVGTATIYDATSRSVPMWRVHDFTSYVVNAVSMLNGVFTVATTTGLYTYDYKVAVEVWYTTELVDLVCNAVAMTVLSGNDFPTIGVGTDGGVSVIDGPAGEGTVVSSSSTAPFYAVSFNESNELFGIRSSSTIRVFAVSDYTTGSFSFSRSINTSLVPAIKSVPKKITTKGGTLSINSNNLGLILLKEDTTTPANGMVNYITSKYQSGWQQGDIKLATLADSVVGDIGLDITTEHVTNGSFITDTDWTKGAGWTIAASLATSDGTQTADSLLTTLTIPVTVADQVYTVSFTLSAWSAGNIALQLDGVEVIPDKAANGTYTATYKASDATGTIDLVADLNFIGSVGAVSLKAIHNLVENSHFSSDRAWTLGTGFVIGSGVATKTAGTASLLSQSILTLAKKYAVTVTLTRTAGSITPYCGTTAGTARSTAGTFTELITCEGDITFDLSADATFAGTVDNVEVFELDLPDVSYNNNPLQVVGELTQSLVHADSDIVAVSGFSATGYIFQPYNADFDFGTGDFCLMGWINTTDTWGTMFSISGNILRLETSSSFIRFKIGSNIYSGVKIVNDEKWHFVVALRVSSVWAIYTDGALDATGASTASATSPTNEPLYIGVDSAGSGAFSGYQSLLRIGAGAPTAAQILEIYNDEKHLFAGNKGLLSGGDNVTALSYDSVSNTRLVTNDDTAGNNKADIFIDNVRFQDSAIDDPGVAASHNATRSAVAGPDNVIYNKSVTS